MYGRFLIFFSVCIDAEIAVDIFKKIYSIYQRLEYIKIKKNKTGEKELYNQEKATKDKLRITSIAIRYLWLCANYLKLLKQLGRNSKPEIKK